MAVLSGAIAPEEFAPTTLVLTNCFLDWHLGASSAAIDTTENRTNGPLPEQEANAPLAAGIFQIVSVKQEDRDELLVRCQSTVSRCNELKLVTGLCSPIEEVCHTWDFRRR
jgi:hypothetical protein